MLVFSDGSFRLSARIPFFMASWIVPCSQSCPLLPSGSQLARASLACYQVDDLQYSQLQTVTLLFVALAYIFSLRTGRSMLLSRVDEQILKYLQCGRCQ